MPKDSHHHVNVKSSNKLGKRQRNLAVGLTSDKALLCMFIVSVAIVTISTILVPLNLEDSVVADTSEHASQSQTHSVSVQLKKPGQSPKQKHSNDEIIIIKEERQQPLKPKPQSTKTKNIPGNSDYFKTHSSPFHVIFSSGCSTFQDWQSYVFFYHVLQSGQEGHVTRIASGCPTSTEENTLKDLFKEEIETMKPGYHHLHLTPDFSRIPKKHPDKFKYFNKPYGVRHWMEHALGYPDNHELHDDSIIVLLDPDQILLRPFTRDFSNSSEYWRLQDVYRGKTVLDRPHISHKVEHGSPFSQQYGYGIQWLTKVRPEYVFQDRLPTPVSNMTRKEATDYYFAMGPPYVATAKDMWSIVTTWSDIVPRVHDEYPYLLAEMFGYNLAAAHLGLRHTIAHSFAVSDIFSGGEGWPLIDAVPAEDVCHNFPPSEYPHVIHYCQRYFLGKWFIGKYKLRKDFISCDSPLLKIPPADLALRYDYAIMPGDGSRKALKPKHAKEEVFMLCAMIDALNSAAKYYKDKHCDKANYEYSYTFFDDMSLPEDKK
ncbi:hypothetical protein IV203_004044 [Nitzschia inconspicua]|uniref:Hydroxyproline O-arabinosyltransferase-like domain-containing protein n=1 Tax=Nitzschia inconspicua TaxID=303405 RepID=A0A9K3PPI2_9STRA|nr:hypothetical protein IV203_004044 [Nitzschia inconspicua]